MSKRTTNAAAEAAAVQSTDAAAEPAASLSAADLKALEEKLEAAEARAAEAEQARAEMETLNATALKESAAALADSEAALEKARSAPAAPAAPAAYAGYQELPAVVAAPLGLNLRTGPGVSFGALEILSDGSPVTVLPLPYGVEIKGWALIVSESGTHGWVRTEFLAEPTAGE